MKQLSKLPIRKKDAIKHFTMLQTLAKHFLLPPLKVAVVLVDPKDGYFASCPSKQKLFHLRFGITR